MATLLKLGADCKTVKLTVKYVKGEMVGQADARSALDWAAELSDPRAADLIKSWMAKKAELEVAKRRVCNVGRKLILRSNLCRRVAMK